MERKHRIPVNLVSREHGKNWRGGLQSLRCGPRFLGTHIPDEIKASSETRRTPPPPTPPLDYLPPPLYLPLRHELTSTTIRNLLDVLDDVLKGELLIRPEKLIQPPTLPSPSDLLPQLDLYLMEIGLQMDKLYTSLSDRVKGAGIIEFSTLIKGVGRLETIRIFILLLFLAQEGRVSLWQNEDTEEIFITVGDLKIGASGETGN